MKYIMYVVILCGLSNSIQAMFKKKKTTKEQENLQQACAAETFGKPGPTPFDTELKKELEVIKQTDPDKYNRLVSAAQKRQAFANSKK